MWFDRAESQDLEYLAQYGVWGGVPAIPIRLPGLGRYGRYKFNQNDLLTRVPLTLSQKKEVLFLFEHFHHVDHFEYFDTPAPPNLKTFKKSYLNFNKSFHPDTYSGLDLGVFSDRVKSVFEYGQQVYQILVEDERFFEIYARVTRLRDQVFRDQLTEDRSSQRAQFSKHTGSKNQFTEDPVSLSGSLKGVSSVYRLRQLGEASEHKRSLDPFKETRSKEEIDERKLKIKARLAENQKRRKSNVKGEQEAQAQTFYHAGIQAEQRQQWVRALNHYKICTEYMPNVSDYVEAEQRVRDYLAQEEATKLWTRGEEMEEIGIWPRAKEQYLASLERILNETHVLQFAQKTLTQNIPEEGIVWIKKGIVFWPLSIPLKLMHVSLLEACSLYDDAFDLCQEVLSLDPSEPSALNFIKKYKRS